MHAINPWAAPVRGVDPFLTPTFHQPMVLGRSSWGAPMGYEALDNESDLILGMIEDEIDLIDTEIEGLDRHDDATGDLMLGRSAPGLSAKIARLEARLATVESKSPTRRRLNRAARIRRRIAKLRDKLQAKLAKQVSRGRLQPEAAAAIAAGAGLSAATAAGLAGAAMMRPHTPGAGPGINAPAHGPANQAYSMLDYPAQPFTGRVPPTQIVNQAQRSPSAGEEVRLPLLVGGSPVSLVNIPAGAGLRTVTIVAESRLIPYAAFQVTGLDVIVNGQPNADALVNNLVSFYGVAGDKNLLYDIQNVSFAGQTKGGPDSTSRRTIAGLRENQILQPTNTVSATVTVRQEIDNAADINLTLELAMVGRSIYDPAVRR